MKKKRVPTSTSTYPYPSIGSTGRVSYALSGRTLDQQARGKSCGEQQYLLKRKDRIPPFIPGTYDTPASEFQYLGVPSDLTYKEGDDFEYDGLWWVIERIYRP